MRRNREGVPKGCYPDNNRLSHPPPTLIWQRNTYIIWTLTIGLSFFLNVTTTPSFHVHAYDGILSIRDYLIQHSCSLSLPVHDVKNAQL